MVILHDINIFTHEFRHEEIATKVVFDTVIAEKYLYYEEVDGQKRLPNIGAFRVGAGTHKYISNCFMAMAMPWSYALSDEEYHAYKEFYCKYYNEELVEFFKLAYEQNCRGVKNRAEEKLILEKKAMKRAIRDFRRKIFFYKYFKSLFGKK